MKHADAELARVLAVRAADLRREEGPVHDDVQLRHVRSAHLLRRQFYLPEKPIRRRDRELIGDLPAQRHLYLLVSVKTGARTVQLEVEDAILPGILERKRRLFLGPLPLDR